MMTANFTIGPDYFTEEGVPMHDGMALSTIAKEVIGKKFFKNGRELGIATAARVDNNTLYLEVALNDYQTEEGGE